MKNLKAGEIRDYVIRQLIWLHNISSCKNTMSQNIGKDKMKSRNNCKIHTQYDDQLFCQNEV